MFNCHACSHSPFATLFGTSEEEPPRKRKKKKSKKGRNSDITTDSASIASRSSLGSRRFEIRSEEEIRLLVQNWETYVHPRAKEFWRDSNKIKETLTQIARGLSRVDDPVLGEDSRCAIWRGSFSEEENLPIVHMISPNITNEENDNNSEEELDRYTSVTRLLVFLYADEESFLELQGKTEKAFRMACNNNRCVSLTHISLDN